MAEAKVDKYVGIDVSKDTLDLIVRPTGTRLVWLLDRSAMEHARCLVR